MVIDKSHPYWHIREVVLREPGISSLVFSYYRYVPNSIGDRRQTISVGREQFLDEEYIARLIASGPFDHELAIHSTVMVKSNELKHIPMIDMSTSAKAHLEKLRPFIDEDIFGPIRWFSSGRSFHGYGAKLVDDRDWVKLMGALLLSNQKDMKPTVDPRWIGHRLLAGYSALRWTRKTHFYMAVPLELGGERNSPLHVGSWIFHSD